MIIFLIPLNVSAISEEAWQEWLKGDINYRVNIEYENQPHAYGYNLLRNSNGELVGVIHVTASQYLEHPIFYAFLNEQPVIQNVTIEGTQYEMKVMEYEKNIHQASCFDQKGIGQGNVHDRCFYYWFTTNLDATFEVENQKHRITAFSGTNNLEIKTNGDSGDTIYLYGNDAGTR